MDIKPHPTLPQTAPAPAAPAQGWIDLLGPGAFDPAQEAEVESWLRAMCGMDDTPPEVQH